MIRFDFSNFEGDNSKTKKILLKSEYTYPDITEITGDFQILINENVFFSEPHFPILEFLKAAASWIGCSDESEEMLYSSIETDENPLIAFTKKDRKWTIRSPWQKYECSDTFDKNDVICAVSCLKKDLMTRISCSK